MLHNRDGHASSLLGQYSNRGWWYYFLVAFALKTSLPFCCSQSTALFWTLFQLIRKRDWRYAWLLAPMLIYALLSMSSHINIGIRHFFPEFGFFFIAVAALLDALLRSKRLRPVTVALLVVAFGWMTVEDVRAYPNYVPYMNQLAASHPKWWYLSDSNVEWGDDAGRHWRLTCTRAARPKCERDDGRLGNAGSCMESSITRSSRGPEQKIPETKYVVIGASFLNGSTNSIPRR